MYYTVRLFTLIFIYGASVINFVRFHFSHLFMMLVVPGAACCVKTYLCLPLVQFLFIAPLLLCYYLHFACVCRVWLYGDDSGVHLLAKRWLPAVHSTRMRCHLPLMAAAVPSSRALSMHHGMLFIFFCFFVFVLGNCVSCVRACTRIACCVVCLLLSIVSVILSCLRARPSRSSSWSFAGGPGYSWASTTQSQLLKWRWLPRCPQNPWIQRHRRTIEQWTFTLIGPLCKCVPNYWQKCI